MSNDDTRTRILNAAGPIFAKKGYQTATVREICQQAGVNVASINYYFGGKGQLYLEVVTKAHPSRFRSGFIADWPPDAPPATKLTGFIRSMLRRLLGIKTASWEEQLLLREIMNPTPLCKDRLREHFRAGFDQLQGILDEILPSDTPAHKRHQIGLSIIAQCVYYRTASKILPLIVGQDELEAHYGVERLAGHISEVSLAALGLAPPLAGRKGPAADGSAASGAAAEGSMITTGRPDHEGEGD
ncbi:MAG: TetR/AcrR family transcriptional regulator [Planctomycetota bacterium]|jgi:AcrR family transcriptional regulator